MKYCIITEKIKGEFENERTVRFSHFLNGSEEDLKRKLMLLSLNDHQLVLVHKNAIEPDIQWTLPREPYKPNRITEGNKKWWGVIK